MMNRYIHFFNIYSLLFSDLRLIHVNQEIFSEIFSEDLNHINTIFSKNIHIKVEKNIFYIEYFSVDKDLEFLCEILSDKKFMNVEAVIENEDIENKILKHEFNNFFYLLLRTYDDNWIVEKEKINYYRDKSSLIYNLFYSIFKTFNWKKDLSESLPFLNVLIKEYKFSIFHLFRARNMFLYYYQVVIWRKQFYQLIINNKNKILESKYMKLIFWDILKSKSINNQNYVVQLFEWFILLHLLDKRGVEKLMSLQWKISNEIFFSDILLLLSNYYIDIWDFKNAEKCLSTKGIDTSFKYYRKAIALFVVSEEKNKLYDLINNLVYQQKTYIIRFYIKWIHDEKINTIKSVDFLKSNENLNIPLNIDISLFYSILEEYYFWKKDKSCFFKEIFKYARKDHRDYFLKTDDISFILQHKV